MSTRQYLGHLGIFAAACGFAFLAFVLHPAHVLAGISPPASFLPQIIVSPRVAPNELQQAFPALQVYDIGTLCLYISPQGHFIAIPKADLDRPVTESCP